MKNRALIGLLATTAMILGGCQTSLQSLPDTQRTFDAHSAITGPSYALPMLAFDIEVTRTLDACGKEVVLPKSVVDAKTDGQPLKDYWLGGPEIVVAGKATPEMIEGERYRFNPAKLTGPSKTTNFQMTYQKGSNVLKGINSSMEDQTGPILGDFAAAGLAVASVVFGPAVAGPAAVLASAMPKNIDSKLVELDFRNLDILHSKQAEGFKFAKTPNNRDLRLLRLTEIIKASAVKKAIVVCTAAATTLLDQSETAAGDKKTKAKEIKATTREIDALVVIAKVRPLSTEQRKHLEQLVIDVDSALRATDALQETLDDIDGKLGIAQKARWPKGFQEQALTRIADAGDAGTIKALLDVAERRVVDPIALARELAKADNADLRREFPDWVATYVWPDGSPRFRPADAAAATPGCTAASIDAVSVDICLAHQLPVAVRLVAKDGDDLPVCDKDHKAPDCLAKGETGVISARDDIADKGLFYRQPVRGELKLCRAKPIWPGGVKPAGEPSEAAVQCAEKEKLIIDKAMLVPQLGQLRFLPLKNDIFENTGLVANFDENGVPTDVSFVTSKAAGAAIVAAAAGIAKQAKEFDDTRRTQRKEDQDAKDKQAAADAAKKKATDDAADIATRTQNLKLAADAQAEADLAKARLAKIIAQACLSAGETATGVPAACPAE